MGVIEVPYILLGQYSGTELIESLRINDFGIMTVVKTSHFKNQWLGIKFFNEYSTFSFFKKGYTKLHFNQHIHQCNHTFQFSAFRKCLGKKSENI